MLRMLVKTFLLSISVSVALPYSAAILCNILYGWPQTKRKFRRALNPYKVYALNYSLLQKIIRDLRFASLFVQWKYFYSRVGPPQVIKDLRYGRNEKMLDLYIPATQVTLVDRPMVMFIYGGSWGSGDKSMYGLLCHNIANRLGAIVVCPNYSLYPQGYVDDMVQDVVDCLSWMYANAENYNGSKEKLMMIGHSAGAHLCAMALIELLIQSEGSLQEGPGSPFAFGDTIRFTDSHFDGKNGQGKIDIDLGKLERSSASSASFCVLNDNGDQTNNNSNSTSTFEVVNGADEDFPNLDASGGLMEGVPSDTLLESIVTEADIVENVPQKHESEEDSEDDSIVTVRQKDAEHTTSLVELVQSIKAVVGLAGVYDISDHFAHESRRGVEDVSTMARAMYAEDHFDRFSPTVVVQTIPVNMRFPKILLLHGTEDYVVPVSSTTKFSEALEEVGCKCTVRILPGCDHYEVCLDLMKPDRKFHYKVMSLLEETAQVFTTP